MKPKIVFLLLFTVLTISPSFSQLWHQWSDPFTITIDSEQIRVADFKIDNNGVYHCVWVRQPRIAPGAKVHYQDHTIKYSKSFDYGETWTEPEIVEQGITDVGGCSDPSIAIDSNNVIYIAYKWTYLVSSHVMDNYLFVKKCENNVWSNADTIDSHIVDIWFIFGLSKLFFDKNNTLYCIYTKAINNGHTICYRTLNEEGVWSDIRQPYPADPNNLFYFTDMVEDRGKDVFHCVGHKSYSTLVYFTLDEFGDGSTPVVVSETPLMGDIALDSLSRPSIAWSARYSPNAFNRRAVNYQTKWADYEEGIWNESIIDYHIDNYGWNAFGNAASHRPIIIIDKYNRKYLIRCNSEKVGTAIYQQLFYYNDGQEWRIADTIEESYNPYFFYLSPVMIEHQDTLYFMYIDKDERDYTHSDRCDKVQLRKYVIPSYCPPPLEPEVAVENNVVHLTWDMPIDTVGLVGYEIHTMDTNTCSVSVRLAELDRLTTYYNDTTSIGYHCYKIAAIYDGNCINYSNKVCAFVQPTYSLCSGVVVDSATQLPISNATVRFFYKNQLTYSCTTDTNGFYNITVPVETCDSIVFSALYFNKKIVTSFEIFEGTNVLNTELIRATLIVSGAVFNAVDESEIPNATIEFSSGITIFSDHVGRFSVTLLEGTFEHIRFSAAGFEDLVVDSFEVVRYNRLVVEMYPLNSTISGVITNIQTSNPIANATVAFTDAFTAITNSDGEYSLVVSSRTFQNIRCSAEHFADYTLESFVAHTGINILDIQLQLESGIVSGIISDIATGLPIANALAQFTEELVAYTDENGFYSIELPAGNYTSLFFTAEHYGNKYINSFIVNDIAETLNVTLNRLQRTVTGVVTDATTNAPINNVSVSFSDEYTATTYIDGEYVILLPVGIYNIRFSAENYEDLVIESFEVTEGENVLDAQLQSINGTVSCVVTNAATNAPINNASVSFSNEYIATTNAEGEYSITLPIGTYHNITFSALYFANYSVASFEVTEGENILNAQLQQSTNGTVSGVVTDAITNAPINNVSVSFSGGYNTTTNSEGKYNITLPVGMYYNIRFSAEHYADFVVPAFEVTENENVLNAALSPKTAINEMESHFNIYPNPAKDLVTIEGENIKSVSVYNIVGQLIEKIETAHPTKAEISTTSYNSGVYIFRIATTDGNVATKRVAISR